MICNGFEADGKHVTKAFSCRRRLRLSHYRLSHNWSWLVPQGLEGGGEDCEEKEGKREQEKETSGS